MAAPLLLLVLLSALISNASSTPIVGVLTEPAGQCDPALESGSCFSSLYVKWIESAGGKVVPIPYDASSARIFELYHSVNAVLFTGGNLNVTKFSSKYVETARILLNLSIEEFEKKNVTVPLWGTCQGMQLLTVLVASAPDKALTTNAFDAEDISLPLQPTHDSALKHSRLFSNLSDEVLLSLFTENITMNLHRNGIEPLAFKSDEKLRGFWNVLTTNRDRRGKMFVSTIEAKHGIPVYAVQWHPERPQFQFNISSESNVAHSPSAVRAMQEVAGFLVNEARRNRHHFNTPKEESEALIYNLRPRASEKASNAHYYLPAQAR